MSFARLSVKPMVTRSLGRRKEATRKREGVGTDVVAPSRTALGEEASPLRREASASHRPGLDRGFEDERGVKKKEVNPGFKR